MGTGKSVVGPMLAQRLGCEFVDTDELIERKAGKAISEIFAKEGEPCFRQLEKQAVEEVSRRFPKVISLGGGAILDFENLTTIKATGVLVCLRAAPEVIWARTKNSTKRPLLEGREEKGLEGGESRKEWIYQRIKGLLAWREPYYQEADFDVDTSNLTPEEVVEEMLEKLGDFTHEGG